MTQEFSLGHWSFVNGLAVFTDKLGRESRYNYDSICLIISNVQKGRADYATEETYKAWLAHFEEGRSLVPSQMV